MNPESYFAPPERSSSIDINLAGKLLVSEIHILDILGASSGVVAFLDENRQIVYANEQFLHALGINSIDKVLGRRVGEAIGCIHSGDMLSGCGTSHACSVCGAVNAIVESQKTGKIAVREARITSESDNLIRYWDLKVSSNPVQIGDRRFFMFTAIDISDEKRRQALERIFFHDILNSAGTLNNILTILNEGTEPDEAGKLLKLSEEVSKELIEEILHHRQLKAAENGDLVLNPEIHNPLYVLEEAVKTISAGRPAKDRKIIIDASAGNEEILTDRVLLKRVLINLLKNALEATDPGGEVHAGIEAPGRTVIYRIRNSSVMSEEVKMQVFQRSFTTKGRGRGIGTYSIKLLTESYLKGKVSFTSTQSEGTEFIVELPLRLKTDN